MTWLPEEEFRQKLSERRVKHREYLQSEWWRGFRRRAIDNAGGRCQFESSIPHLNVWIPRCQHTGRLDVHHLNYDTLYRESYEDVEVLCRFHHHVREIMKVKCELCLEEIFGWEEDAINFLLRYCPPDDDEAAHKLTMDDLRDFVSDYCQACEDMLEDEDD